MTTTTAQAVDTTTLPEPLATEKETNVLHTVRYGLGELNPEDMVVSRGTDQPKVVS